MCTVEPSKAQGSLANVSYDPCRYSYENPLILSATRGKNKKGKEGSLHISFEDHFLSNSRYQKLKIGTPTGGAHGCITEGLKKASSIQCCVEERQVYMRSSFLIVIPQLGLILLLVKRLNRSSLIIIKKRSDLEVGKDIRL